MASETRDPISQTTREVYENAYTHELTFDYDPKTCVCVGTTTGTLADWKLWHVKQLMTTEPFEDPTPRPVRLPADQPAQRSPFKPPLKDPPVTLPAPEEDG